MYFNEWGRNYKVMGVSENFVISSRKMFGRLWYSICDKRNAGFKRNAIVEDRPYMGGDDHYCFFDYTDEEEVEKALECLESGKLLYHLKNDDGIRKKADEEVVSGFEISVRSGVEVKCFAYKRGV